MRAKLVLLALSCAPVITACSFLLDFNRLQGEKKATPDAGSDVASELDSGNAGTAGATSDDGGAAEDSGTRQDGGAAEDSGAAR